MQAAGEVVLFPAADVMFQDTEGEWITLFMMVDSGATISALPKNDAPVLGVEAESGEEAPTYGIGVERINGWRHTLPVRLDGIEVDLPVVFLDTEVPTRILGRAGVFERFTVVFEEAQRRTALLGGDDIAEVQEALNGLENQ